MILGMIVSAAIAILGLLMGIGRIGHPVDGQLVTTYGWSILIVGAALFVLFAVRYRQGRRRSMA